MKGTTKFFDNLGNEIMGGSEPINFYTVSVTFTDMGAKNPLDAAKKACKWLLENNNAETMIYDVMDEETEKKFTVDLSEEDEDAVLPNND